MIVSDAAITSSTGFAIAKSSENIISHVGETTPVGKYTAVAGSGTVTFVIKNTIVADEDTYSCTLDTGESATDTIQVDGRYRVF